MCTAENIYYTTCGCFSGHHVIWACPKSTAISLSGASCPDTIPEGVFRRQGKCLPCRRRDWQQEVLTRSGELPLTGDVVSDRLTILSEVMRRAMEGASKKKNETGQETGQETGHTEINAEAGGAKAEEKTSVSVAGDGSILTDREEKTDEHHFETECTSWHQV
ncbi:hypothetical protein CkaCkLH20_00379 [Colletotrichum karsti]|uniref:Uncharacterized protein n=1 Tax=Colletotrichum karsti TaxID=1095194 RepID=A0A9P6LQH3_9PEZI|nr:uncharacterized protein CkaCkLH20_00379 [Colletotrichum karsti]KAF9882343.1 hypothetical protein CkaCkLH20_00379 [Colletotrichum karsti]